MSISNRPSIFIGSSAEGLKVAYALQELLHYDMEPTVWSQGLFQPSASLLQKLVHEANSYDLACFVFVPDDDVFMRDEKHKVVRDNVLFEYGLFVGAIGLERCFLVSPFDEPKLHLPSDLLGVVPLAFNSTRTDKNLVAALGPAANQLRRAWHEASLPEPAVRLSRSKDTSTGAKPRLPLSELQLFWESAPLLEDRALLRDGISWDPSSEDFPRAAILRIFAFLESLSDAVLSLRAPESEAQLSFGVAVNSFWPHAAVSLAYPGSPDEFWKPLPQLANLFHRWAK